MARLAPDAHASMFAVGTRRRGNDGAMYEVRATSNGVRRWVRVSTEAASKDAVIVLRPSAGVIDMDRDGEITEISIGRATMRGGPLTLADFVGKRAMRVVQRSLEHTGVHRIASIAFDMAKHNYVIHVKCNDPVRLEKELALRFGPSASDTWMEGDVTITPQCELHLALLSVAPRPWP